MSDSKIDILLLGSGGREHALLTKLAESPRAGKMWVAPGNGGMDATAEVADLDPESPEGVAAWAVGHGIGLVVIGPEVPLVAGVADAVRAAGIPTFGPNGKAAQMEGSKKFAKEVMERAGVPTAAYRSFTDEESCSAYVREVGGPIVVKADGLAAGKGVVVAQTEAEAIEAVNAMMEDHIFGASGGRIVIEECMVGEEASLLAFVDGKTIVPMISAQDHKRIFDNDEGPNTGGMGAYAPAPVVTPEIRKEVEEKILKPVVDGLKQEGITYQGCLYAGLMITADGPKVVEFNCRFGDPETQAVLPLLDGDLAQIMYACAKGTLTADMVHWKDAASCCVIMASAGYPASSHKGDVISGLDAVDKEDVMVFHSGTAKKDGQYVTNGGRVLGVTAVAGDLKSAIEKAYANVKRIHFDGQQVRSDIGAKGLKHLK